MKTLAIDTASEICGVGVADATELLALVELPLSAARSRNLTPLIVTALRRARMTLDEIQLIAVAAGPGSFNGLRVGLATAYGLRASLATELVAVSTLQAMAWSVGFAAADPRARVAILDARRGQVFAARFEFEGGDVRRRSPDALMILSDACGLAAADDLILTSPRHQRELADVGVEARAFATSVVAGLLRCANVAVDRDSAAPASASYLRGPR